MPTVKIISGHSERGGSTTVFITLTNALNKAGIDCTFYGPHSWHLNKCKSGLIFDATFDKNDVFITHFVKLKQRPDVKRVVLSCHEKNLYKVGEVKQHWDEVVFINDKQREYHSAYKGPYSIIPNLRQELTSTDKIGLDRVAAVIGSIDYNKQTHTSIERALKDGCEKVYVYGTINDPNYFKQFVEKLFTDKRVIYKGYQEDKQLIYNGIGRVYHSSISEVACLIKDECLATNTIFYGNSATSHITTELSNKEILQLWLKVLQIL